MTLLDYDPAGPALVLHAGPRDHEFAKAVPGLRFDAKTGNWTGFASWGTALALRGQFLSDLKLTPRANEWGASQVAREAWAESLKTWQPPVQETDALGVCSWADGLRPLQQTAVGFLSAQRRACVFDGTGGGKGVVTARALSTLPDDAFPALIVCPRSVKHTHRRFLETWAPDLNAYVVAGTATKRRKMIEAGLSDPRGVLIMNWESVIEHSFLAPYGSTVRSDKEKEPKELNDGRLKTVVFDEAHRAKDPKSKRTRAAWAVGHAATRCWLTTATPITDPMGLWAVMHLVVPWETPSSTKYRDRYCLTETVYAKGGREVEVVRAFNPRTEQELRRIFAPYILRRSEREIAPDLPPVVYETMWVEMEDKQRRAYDEMRKHMMTTDEAGNLLVATDPMLQSGRLLQLASAMPEVDSEGNVEALAEPSSKVTAVLDWLEDHPGEQAVVFAQSRKLLELLARVLEKKKVDGDKVPFAMITGEVNDAARDVAEQQFQEGDLRLLLGTYGAMSEGLTLTAASTQLMLQRSFELVKNVQADGRCCRIGQTANKVTIIDVVSTGSYDEAVFLSGAYKEESAQQFLRDPEWIKRQLEEK